MLCSLVLLGLPSGLFPSGFPTNILYAALICATRPAHLILLDFIIPIILGEEFNEAPHYVVFCDLLLLYLSSVQIFFSNTLSLCSSFNVRAQVSHPYRITGKIIIFYILIFTFLDSRREDERKVLNQMVADITRIQSPLNFFLNQIWFFTVVPNKIELCHIFKTSVTYLYAIILPCILVTRQQHAFSFLYVYF
jgi:hypothetical protein